MDKVDDKYWMNSYAQAVAALSESRYSDARAIFDALLGYVESRYGEDDVRAAACHQGLGESLAGIEDRTGAERHFKRGVVVLEHSLGALHPMTLKAMTAFGAFYRRTKQSDRAEHLLTDALRGWSQLTTYPALDLCETLDNLAGLYCEQGREQDAQPLINQAVGIRKRDLSKDRSEAINHLIEHGDKLAQQKRYGEAEKLLREALQLMESYYGRNDLHIADLLIKMMHVAVLDFRPGDAIPLMERVLCIQAIAYGKGDVRVVNAIRRLGQLNILVGRGPQAVACFEEALDISRMLNGENSTETADDLHKLAFVYRHIECLDKAEGLALGALKIREQALGKTHPDVLSLYVDLAEIYSAQGRTADAETVESRIRESLRAAQMSCSSAAV